MKCLAISNEGRFELRRPQSESEWQSYHCIRERALWCAIDMQNTFGPYDSEHPAQYADDYTPLVLLRNTIVTGTVGLQDMGTFEHGREVEVRGVAIDPACQGQGYGRIMLMMAESAAFNTGFARAGAWSDQSAVMFYARNGYIHRTDEHPQRLACPVNGAIPMTKRLDLGVAQNDGSVLIAAA